MQGKTINGFELKRPLGVGGMAEVWYAENEIGMKAAVKILSDELSRNAQMKERFLNEAKVMVKLDHPNIRKVYGYGSIDERPAIIMEYLDGTDLKAKLKRGQRFSEAQLEKWWNQLVDALNYTHSQNIVHRDIKPSNIFLDNKDDVKLLDFGIAKLTDTTSGTLTGSTLGTRIYMSPEQVKDPKRVGPKSDVYSLAVSFVHLLTGKAPYDSTTSSDFDIQYDIVSKPLDLSRVPSDWRGFLEPYLTKDPQQRPELRHFSKDQSFAVDNDEGTVVEGMGTKGKTQQQMPRNYEAQPVGITEQPKAKKNKSLLWMIIAAAAVVALLAVLLFGKSGGKSGGDVAPPVVSISPTKMNVVYRGIDNPIAVGGGVGGDISATASSGTLNRTGDGTYNLRPGEANEVTVSITSAGSSLGSMKFRVADLPKPTAIIRNVVSGRVSKSALLAAGRVEAEMKDFSFNDAHYDVVGYTFRYKTKSGTTKEVKTNSGAFTDEIKNVINMANVGDMFVFADITVRGNDGKTKTLETPIGIEIK